MKLITGKAPEEIPRNFMDSFTQSLMNESPLQDNCSSKAEIVNGFVSPGIISVRMSEFPVIVSREGEPVGYQYRDASIRIDLRKDYVPSVALIVESSYSPEKVQIPEDEKFRLQEILQDGSARVVYSLAPRRLMQIVTEKGAVTFFNGVQSVESASREPAATESHDTGSSGSGSSDSSSAAGAQHVGYDAPSLVPETGVEQGGPVLDPARAPDPAPTIRTSEIRTDRAAVVVDLGASNVSGDRVNVGGRSLEEDESEQRRILTDDDFKGVRISPRDFEQITGQNRNGIYRLAKEHEIKGSDVTAYHLKDHIAGMRGKSESGKPTDVLRQEAMERLEQLVLEKSGGLSQHTTEVVYVTAPKSELRDIKITVRDFLQVTGKGQVTLDRFMKDNRIGEKQLTAGHAKDYIQNRMRSIVKGDDSKNLAIARLERLVSERASAGASSEIGVPQEPHEARMPVRDVSISLSDVDDIKISAYDFERVSGTLESYSAAQRYRTILSIRKTEGTTARKMRQYIEKFSGTAHTNSINSANSRLDTLLYMSGLVVAEIDKRNYYTSSEIQFMLDCPVGSLTAEIKKSRAKKVTGGYSKKDIHIYLEERGKMPEKLKARLEGRTKDPVKTDEPLAAQKKEDQPVPPNPPQQGAEADTEVTARKIPVTVSINQIAEQLNQDPDVVRNLLVGYRVNVLNGIVLVSDLERAARTGRQLDPILHNLGYTDLRISEIARTDASESDDYLEPDLTGIITKTRFGEIIGTGREALADSLVSRYRLGNGSGQLSKIAVAKMTLEVTEFRINDEVRRMLLSELGLPQDIEKARAITHAYEAQQRSLSVTAQNPHTGTFNISNVYPKGDLENLGLKRSDADYIRQRTGGMPEIPGYRIVGVLLEENDFNTLARMGIKGKRDEVQRLVDEHKERYKGSLRSN